MVRRSLEQPPPRSRPRDAAVAPIVEEVDPAMAGEQRLRNTSAMLAIGVDNEAAHHPNPGPSGMW